MSSEASYPTANGKRFTLDVNTAGQHVEGRRLGARLLRDGHHQAQYVDVNVYPKGTLAPLNKIELPAQFPSL